MGSGSANQMGSEWNQGSNVATFWGSFWGLELKFGISDEKIYLVTTLVLKRGEAAVFLG